MTVRLSSGGLIFFIYFSFFSFFSFFFFFTNSYSTDYIGGHIVGSLHFASGSLDATMPTLLRKLQDADTVVFHCALSQQRGPSAALRYLREVAAQQNKKTTTGGGAAVEPSKPQTVYVLDRGFVGWQEVYGDDETLTEGYRKELWKYY